MATQTSYYLGAYLKCVSPIDFDEILEAIQLSIFSHIREYLIDILSKKGAGDKWEIFLISNDSDLEGERFELHEQMDYPITGAIESLNVCNMKEAFREHFENQITTLENCLGDNNVTVEFGLLIYYS